MKAVVQQGYGPAEKVWSVQDIPVPEIGDDQVLVKVHAAAMHPDIWHVLTGSPKVIRLATGLTGPKAPVPGTDVAGVVDKVGSNVTDFAVGDAVFGEIVHNFQWQNGGSFAEYAAVDASTLLHKPDGVSFEQAAAVSTSGLIAVHNLKGAGELGPDDRVLVNGAAGGVGVLAMQLAKAAGAHVTAVDHGNKLGRLRDLGADAVIDYTTTNVTEGDARYTVIFDVASTLTLSACKRVLSDDGTYIRIGHEHYQDDALVGNLGGFMGLVFRSIFDRHLPPLDFAVPSLDDLRTLRDGMASGALNPVVDRVFPLEQAAEALAYMRQGTAIGRIVMVPG